MRENLIDKLTQEPAGRSEEAVRRPHARAEAGRTAGSQARCARLRHQLPRFSFRSTRIGTKTEQLSAFDELGTRHARASLQTLKRNYVIKLFADHADTQCLFTSLAKDLERLIG